MSVGIRTGTELDHIVEARRADIAVKKRTTSERELRSLAENADQVRDFPSALLAKSISIIAELKKASPAYGGGFGKSGVIRSHFDPASLAYDFQEAGASALSVLTEERNFQGDLRYLREARKASSIPVLRKDFIVDTWQVWETRAAGSDSFLLMAAILDRPELKELLDLGRELGMEPLVEAHTHEELDRALWAGAHIVGVNNRNLRELRLSSLDVSLNLIEYIPEECIAVSESGLKSNKEIVMLLESGFDAFLIGTQLMKQRDPAEALREMIHS